MRGNIWDPVSGASLNFTLALKNNFAATADPGTGDDSADGYEVGSTWVNITAGRPFVCIDATEGAAVWALQGESGIDPTELALLNGAVAGAVVASKAAAYGADSILAIFSGALAAAGTNQATATPLTKQANAITGADGTVGVALLAAAVNRPQLVINTDATHILPVYPVASGNDQINGIAVNSPFNLGPGQAAWFVPTSAIQFYVAGSAALFPVGSVAAGLKVVSGVHQQAAASDTIITGLTTVVSVVACFRDAPTVKQLFCAASIGNQSGAPAAGSFLLNTYKPTAVNDVTPTAATDFSGNINFDWIAFGT